MARWRRSKTGGAAFMSAIESEVESLADGSAARFIGERVKEQLSVLVTAHHGRPTGEYKSALDELARLEAQKPRRRSGSGARRSGSTSWRRCGTVWLKLADPEAVQAREQAANEARRAFEEAREAREKAQGGRPGCRLVRETSRRVETGARRLRPARRRTRQVAGRGRRQRATARRGGNACGALKARVVESRQARDALKRALTADGMQPAHAGAVGAPGGGAPRPCRMRAHERRARRQRSRG